MFYRVRLFVQTQAHEVESKNALRVLHLAVRLGTERWSYAERTFILVSFILVSSEQTLRLVSY